MKILAWALSVLAVLLTVATLTMWASAPWVRGADSARLFGTGFIVLLGAVTAGVGAIVAWRRA